MKKITLSITKPILNHGEKLLGVRYEVNEKSDFTGREILNVLKKDGVGMYRHEFSYNFITDEYVYARVTLRIQDAEGNLYDNIVSIKSINSNNNRAERESRL